MQEKIIKRLEDVRKNLQSQIDSLTDYVAQIDYEISVLTSKKD